MNKLIHGVRQFQEDIYPRKQALFQSLAAGQHPEALMVACSDSRVSLELITQTGPGDIFVCRNAGNIVPSRSEGDGVAATIEYAVTALLIPDIIVCGHSDCGAMKALLNSEDLHTMPAVKNWLQHAQSAYHALGKSHRRGQEAQAVNELSKLNVRIQLEHLKNYPHAREAVERGRLRLHGWFYEIDSGAVWAWDAADATWAPLETSGRVAPGKTFTASREA